MSTSILDSDAIGDITTATILKVQTAKPVRAMHKREPSHDSLDPHMSPRVSSRCIPPPTPPPRAALPPTPSGSAAQWTTLPQPEPATQQRLLGLGVEGLDSISVANIDKSAAFKSRQQQLFFLKTQRLDKDGRVMTLSFSTPDLSDAMGSPMNTESCSEASTPPTDSPSPSKTTFDRTKLKEEATRRLAKQQVALRNLSSISSNFDEVTPPVSPDGVRQPSLSRAASESQLTRIPENPEAEEQLTPVRPSSRDRAVEFLAMSGRLSRALDPRPRSAESDASGRRDDLTHSVRAMADAPTTPRLRGAPASAESEEIRALRYALRYALDEVDKTHELLEQSRRKKSRMERELKMTQSSLLLAEAQLSLMQEEAASASKPDATPKGTERHLAARPPSVAGSVQGKAKPVSIASLRKAPIDPRRDQRYVPKSMQLDDDEEDDDEEDDFMRKPAAKQVSLGNFLEASRMSKEELAQAATPVAEIVSQSLAVGSSSKSGLFKSLTTRNKRNWTLELPKKSASVRARRPEFLMEESIVPSTLAQERQQMQREVEDLTASLFSETNNLLADERRRNAALARRLDEIEKRFSPSRALPTRTFARL